MTTVGDTPGDRAGTHNGLRSGEEGRTWPRRQEVGCAGRGS